MNIKSEPLLRICLIEDDPLVIKSLSGILREQSRLWSFNSIDELFLDSPEINASNFDLIILDLRHAGDPQGLRSIAGISELIRRWPDAMVLVASGVDDLQSMRQCVARGADRFVTKDGLLRELPQILATAAAWKERRVAMENHLTGDSVLMRALKRDLFRIQGIASDILLQGETGSGKEVAARALHLNGPFVAINVTTVPADLFESTLFGHEKGAFTGAQNQNPGMLMATEGGTLFLDEFQSLSLEHQGKLLRFLETREYFSVGSQKAKIFKGRIIFASNQNLPEMVERGSFREDLFFRISQISVKIPPLRMRRSDIPGLIERFLSEDAPLSQFRFSSDGLDFLISEYEWPGNVRELRGLIRALVATSRIPVWGRSEIESALGIKNSDSPASSVDALAGQAKSMNGNFEIIWTAGLDENLDRLTHQMILQLSATMDSNAVQTQLRLKKSRFYKLLQDQKKAL